MIIMIELKYSIEYVLFLSMLTEKERNKKNSYLPVIGTSAVLYYRENLKKRRVA
jgi:hypothetical protein